MAKDGNSLSGLEERLIKLIEAQAELLNEFISETGAEHGVSRTRGQAAPFSERT